MVRQGVTTQVIGNCGYSCAPVRDETKEALEKYMLPPRVEIDWHSLGEYLHRLESQGVSTNVASLVGHGVVRIAVMGWADRRPKGAEIEEMKDLVAQSMEEGAFGLSTGLAYSPGLFSDTDEIVELAKVAARYHGFYSTHIRTDGMTWERSVQEAIEIGEKARLPVQISHIESHYPNWGRQERILRLIEEARLRGLDVLCDIPPYICGATSLNTILPDWAHEGGASKSVERLRNPEMRARIKKFVLEERERHSLPIPTMLADGLSNKIRIGSSEKNRNLIGKSLSEIGELRGTDPIEAAFDIIVEECGGDISITAEQHSEEDMRRVVQYPGSMIASDGASWAPYGVLGDLAKPNPRGYGVFPLTFRKYVRGETRKEMPSDIGEKILTLQDAIRKMTSLPAQRLGLKDRGLIRERMWADIVIFDPETIEDQATYDDPHQYPKGIEYVLVNGTIVVEKGNHTGALPGKVLRGPGYKAS
jgi:N-acyl-D-amino-acid deacylase